MGHRTMERHRRWPGNVLQYLYDKLFSIVTDEFTLFTQSCHSYLAILKSLGPPDPEFRRTYSHARN